MIAQELLSLVQQLSFVFRTGAEITPPQLLQDLVPCCLTHALIHFRHANSHFWHNVSIPLSLPPSSGNKTFGAMRLCWTRWSSLALRAVDGQVGRSTGKGRKRKSLACIAASEECKSEAAKRQKRF